MSAPFVAALAWTTGTTSYAGMRTYDNPDVMKLVPLVTIVGDESVERYQTKVRIELDDGSTLALDDLGGGDSYEISWEAAVASTVSLCAEVGARGAAVERLIAAADRLDQADDVTELIAAVRAIIAAA
jgi:hypothetical protein